jgi:hypothetical protein
VAWVKHQGWHAVGEGPTEAAAWDLLLDYLPRHRGLLGATVLEVGRRPDRPREATP